MSEREEELADRRRHIEQVLWELDDLECQARTKRDYLRALTEALALAETLPADECVDLGVERVDGVLQFVVRRRRLRL